MTTMAGATTLGNLASAITGQASANKEEASIVAQLKAGSDAAYEWLIAHYHQPVYSIVYRMLNDPADAADTTQEVFLKVFRGMNKFNGDASLKTWIYRIAVHEASNHKRWWFRHKRQETTIEPSNGESESVEGPALKDTLVDVHDSPFQLAVTEEIRSHVESALREVAEPFRTVVVLRDIEEMSYEEMAAVLQVSLGTVKSRLVRGRKSLKKKLAAYVDAAGHELGIKTPADGSTNRSAKGHDFESRAERAVFSAQKEEVRAHEL